MKTVLIASLLLSACTVAPGTGADEPPVEPPDAPPAGTSQLALCAAGEGDLRGVWSVDNGHGAVSALTVAPSGTAALAGADGTVKTWDINSGELDWNSAEVVDPGAAYGAEIASAGPLTALRFDGTGQYMAGGDAFGSVLVWSADTGFAAGGWTAGEEPITAVAQGFEGQLIASATSAYGGELRTWNLVGTPEVEPLATGLWFVNALRLDDNDFVVAGDIYGEPAVELRSAAFPSAVIGAATARGVSGSAHDVANLGEGRFLLAGSGFLVVLDTNAVDGDQIVALAESEHDYVSIVALDDTHFAAATAGGRVQLGTTADLEILSELESAPMSAMEAVPGGWQLAASGDDGVLRLIGCEG